MTSGTEPLSLADFNLKAPLSSLVSGQAQGLGLLHCTLGSWQRIGREEEQSQTEVLLTEAALNPNPRPDATRKAWMTSTDFPVTATRNNTHLTKQETGVGRAGVTVTCLSTD